MKAKLLILVLSGITIINIGHSQSKLDKSLWVATMVHDTLGKSYPRENINRFMYFENENNIATLAINQKTSMSTGETIVSYIVEANNLAKINESTFKVKEYKVDNFSIISEDSIYYREKYYHIGFKRLDISASNHLQNDYLDFLLKNKVREFYENGESLNQIHKYKADGNKEIEVVDSASRWESPYRILSFEGYVFLRGITSNPILLKKMKEDRIEGYEIDRKKGVIKTEIRIVK